MTSKDALTPSEHRHRQSTVAARLEIIIISELAPQYNICFILSVMEI